MWAQLIVWVVTTLISYYLRPKAETPAPAALSDFSIPTASASRPVPVLFGTRTIRGGNVTWYGDLRSTPITAGSKK